MLNLDENLSQINKNLIEMMKSVERLLQVSINMFSEPVFNKVLYGETKVLEEEIDEYEVKIDEKIVQSIARFQPTAYNLRYFVGGLHITKTLERIGDISINILKTQRRIFKDKFENPTELVPLIEMGRKVYNMYEIFTKGYMEKDLESVYLVFGLDDEIDDMRDKNLVFLKQKIKEDVECVDLAIENLYISRYYERIADNITNLAESYIYILKGEDLRHKKVEIEK